MQRVALGIVVFIIVAVILFFTAMIFLSAPEGQADGPAPTESEVSAALGSNRQPVLVAPSGLAIPVAGVRPGQLVDTYSQARAGGARVHDAIDIMAPRGTPVLAADDGRVYKLRRNPAGGITIYALDPESRFVYYYAHLDRYREGLAEGAPLAKGEVIGYVGTTGNAPASVPHLHFQVMRLTTERRYWDGVPVNPKPFFALDGTLASSQ